MRQLTSLDAQFLALENATHYGHVAGLAVLDPSTAPDGRLDVADVTLLIAQRLPLLPPLRWRLAEVPLGMDYGYWVDDPNFDLDYHVRELALSAPGSDHQLAAQVARLISRPLDRARPLWELYLISGLPQGRVAMLTKIHHALVDGVSGAEIMGLLLDLSPEGREPAPADTLGPGDQWPSQLQLLARGLLGLPRYPLRLLRSLPSAVPHLEEAAPFNTIPGVATLGRLAGRLEAALPGERAAVARSTLKAPSTSFNGRITAHRRFAFGQIPLAPVKAVKKAYGCMLNDVVVSICAGAVRRWLVEHDELPSEPLVAQIPISVRSRDQRGTYGNRIMLMGAPLFTNEADPVRRLALTHEALVVMKDRHAALPAALLQDANHFIPPAVLARAARVTFSLATSGPGRPSWNLVVSNVPGPQFPLYCAGAQLVANYPASVVTDGMGLNITVMSYCGHLDFGLVADRDAMPDLWRVMDWLSDALAELELEGPREGARDTEPAPVG